MESQRICSFLLTFITVTSNKNRSMNTLDEGQAGKNTESWWQVGVQHNAEFICLGF